MVQICSLFKSLNYAHATTHIYIPYIYPTPSTHDQDQEIHLHLHDTPVLVFNE